MKGLEVEMERQGKLVLALVGREEVRCIGDFGGGRGGDSG